MAMLTDISMVMGKGMAISTLGPDGSRTMQL